LLPEPDEVAEVRPKYSHLENLRDAGRNDALHGRYLAANALEVLTGLDQP
jgi:hypothetical protein